MDKKTIAWGVLALIILMMFAACGGEQTASDVVNSGSPFVKHGDAIYYRQYRSDSFESSGIWDSFDWIPGSTSDFMKLSADGTAEKLFEDDGTGDIFLYGGGNGELRFLLTGASFDEGVGYSQPEVYSVDMAGGDRTSYGNGWAFALDETRHLAIISAYRGGISVVDLHTSESTLLTEAYRALCHYDEQRGVLYSMVGEYVSDDTVFALSSIDIESGTERLLLDMAREDFETLTGNDYFGDYYEVQNIWTDEGKLFVYIAGYGGSGYMYYDSVLLEIDEEKGDIRVAEASPRDWYGTDSVFTPIVDGPHYEADREYYVYRGKAVEPENVLSTEDFQTIGLEEVPGFGEERFSALTPLAYFDDLLFFRFDTGVRNEQEDIGWRWGYDRTESRVYRKLLKTSEIDLLFTY